MDMYASNCGMNLYGDDQEIVRFDLKNMFWLNLWIFSYWTHLFMVTWYAYNNCHGSDKSVINKTTKLCI
jgi:hypothetical protein